MAATRNATLKDAARLAELSNQLGYPSTDAEVASRLAGLLDHPDHAVFVAEDGEHVVAWIQVSLSRLVESPLSAEVGGLVVDEDHRGRGVGPLLLAVADAWARERGAVRLRVPCNVVRADAHRFYEREGFREVKKQRIFERALRSIRRRTPSTSA